MPAKLAVFAAFALTLLISGLPSVAEDARPRMEVVGSEEKLLSIEVNQGRLVRLGTAASSVFIADPAVADVQVKSPTLVYLFGRKAGVTTMFAVDEDDRILANLRVSVSHNLSQLKSAIGQMFPESFIDVSSVGDAVMLSGVVRNSRISEDARALAARFSGGDKNVLNRLSVRGPNQVNLRVRVAEVSRAVVKQIGINWESVMSVGSFVFGLGTGRDFIEAGQIARSPIGANNLSASMTTGRLDINALLDALESEGLVSVLAEPNLTAVTGETASFLAGGEFPITVPQGDGSITIQFKKFGVGLAFTPTLLDEGRVSLKVRPEVSQLSSTGEVRLNNIAIPALATRRAETTVELASGQSFAVAGLIQNNLSHDVQKFPGLGDLPILGPLFRSTEFRRNESELVIIITPYVVRPVSTRDMSDPVAGLDWPTDRERVIDGAPLYRPKVGRPPAAIAASGGAGLAGQAGFTLE